jgi:hypothetical protein
MPIHVKRYPEVGWWILISFLVAIVFVVIIDSYWPILLNIYSVFKKLAKYMKEAAYGNQNKEEELINSSNINNTNSNYSFNPPSVHNNINCQVPQIIIVKQFKETENNHILLKLWILLCIACSFVAALFISVVITTYIQQLFLIEEDVCVKLDQVFITNTLIEQSNETNRLNKADNKDKLIESANNNKAGITQRLTILGESTDSEGNFQTTVQLECNSNFTDEMGNKWKIIGPAFEECGKDVEFNYTKERYAWTDDACYTQLKWEWPYPIPMQDKKECTFAVE